MTQEKPEQNKLVVKESRTKKLVYTPEFKRTFFSDPRMIRKFMKLSRLIKRNETRGDDDFSVTLFTKRGHAEYYRIIASDQIFFVKKFPLPAYRAQGGGFGEILSSQQAKEVLSKKGIANVEIIDFQLGYEDSKNRFFVSRWNDRLQNSLLGYITDLRYRIQNLKQQPTTQEISQEIRDETVKLEKLIFRKESIKGALDDFYDLNGLNMAYDPVSDKIIIFDLYEKKYPH